MNLLIFNPDHDLALAHGTFHYVSPMSAQAFANDAAAIPAWIYRSGSVLVPQMPDANFLSLCSEFDLPVAFVPRSDLEVEKVSSVTPWGWNYNLKKILIKNGLQESILPTDEMCEHIRDLSHRRLTIEAARFISERFSRPELLPVAASELRRMEDVEGYLFKHGSAIFKMPWSGSGRGLRRVVGVPTVHQTGWIRQSIRKFGSIMAEPLHQVTADFAMEFLCDSGQASFAGYSLFHTRNGVYTDNVLLSDSSIKRLLSAYICPSLLDELQALLTDFLNQNVAPSYSGCVGVDMFVYKASDGFCINPFVEFNIRTTMGYLSTLLAKRYLAEGREGSLRVRYLAENNALLCEDALLKDDYPLSIVDGKIDSGYLSLTPIGEDAHYAIQVFVR